MGVLPQNAMSKKFAYSKFLRPAAQKIEALLCCAAFFKSHFSERIGEHNHRAGETDREFAVKNKEYAAIPKTFVWKSY